MLNKILKTNLVFFCEIFDTFFNNNLKKSQVFSMIIVPNEGDVIMIYPSIDKLLNQVGSKYELIGIISKRSKQMQEFGNYQLSDNEYKSSKFIGRAMEELEKGLIKVKEK